MISYFNNTPMQISSFDLNGANGTSTFDRIQSTATWCIIIFIITTALLPGYGESGYGYGSEYDGELPTLLSNQCQHNHVDFIRILSSSYYDNFNVHYSRHCFIGDEIIITTTIVIVMIRIWIQWDLQWHIGRLRRCSLSQLFSYCFFKL